MDRERRGIGLGGGSTRRVAGMHVSHMKAEGGAFGEGTFKRGSQVGQREV